MDAFEQKYAYVKGKKGSSLTQVRLLAPSLLI